MTSNDLSRRTIVFVNIAHSFDHFILLIYPTAVIAIAVERGLDYAMLITLATGAFVAFGLCSLPVGWLAARYGSRNMLAVFFVGYGLSCIGVSTQTSLHGLAIWLLILGVFSAIYHPIGSDMIVTHAQRPGRSLGWNGAWGNIGAASAPGVTALIATTVGWQAAFVVPGLICIGIGILFIILVPYDGEGQNQEISKVGKRPPVARPIVLLAIFGLAIVAGGLTFNMTTISLPKIVDERLGTELSLVLTGSLATIVFLLGALTQVTLGRMIENFSLPMVFLCVAIFQPIGLMVAATSTGPLMLMGLVMAMAAIYGQVVVNDAIVASYVPRELRAKAFSLRYFMGFTVGGFAIPIIAFLHSVGEFPLVLAAMACFGTLVFISSIAFALEASRVAMPASVQAASD
ncbi:MAG: MFS transporter [Rhodobacteraceae bacterium]|nr:MFS transporter [Paracoccaceae bacterium]